MQMPGVAFVDLEEIDGVIEAPLAREPQLDALPPDGAWLPPRQSLLELYGPR